MCQSGSSPGPRATTLATSRRRRRAPASGDAFVAASHPSLHVGAAFFTTPTLRDDVLDAALKAALAARVA